MSVLHVCPQNDSVAHTVDQTATCPCQPTVQDEGTDARGYVCQTVIHQVALPTTDGQRLVIRKVWVDVTDGHILKVDDTVRQQQAYRSRRPGMAARQDSGAPGALEGR